MVLAIVVACLISTLIIGARLSSRIRRATDYLVAGRHLGLALTTGGVSTDTSGSPRSRR